MAHRNNIGLDCAFIVSRLSEVACNPVNERQAPLLLTCSDSIAEDSHPETKAASCASAKPTMTSVCDVAALQVDAQTAGQLTAVAAGERGSKQSARVSSSDCDDADGHWPAEEAEDEAGEADCEASSSSSNDSGNAHENTVAAGVDAVRANDEGQHEEARVELGAKDVEASSSRGPESGVGALSGTVTALQNVSSQDLAGWGGDMDKKMRWWRKRIRVKCRKWSP